MKDSESHSPSVVRLTSVCFLSLSFIRIFFFPNSLQLGILWGKKFCTTTDTLTQREPDSMLAAMFSGRHTLFLDSDKAMSNSGYVFVDRDGKHFHHILNWLRDGVVPILEDSEYNGRKEGRKEAKGQLGFTTLDTRKY
ncbi:hypothetical protein AHAS_Ahas20G0213200 [Arachis hypogaea]